MTQANICLSPEPPVSVATVPMSAIAERLTHIIRSPLSVIMSAADQLDQLPPDKDAKIVVYCRSDRMSRISIEEWVKAGYTNLYNLDGGFEAWEAAGYELLQK